MSSVTVANEEYTLSLLFFFHEPVDFPSSNVCRNFVRNNCKFRQLRRPIICPTLRKYLESNWTNY